MKVAPTERTEMDLGFQLPEAGTYIWQFIEGIEVYHRDDSQGVSIGIPMQVDKVVNGSADAVDCKATHFIVLVRKDGVVNTFGETQLMLLLTIAGLAQKFAEKFTGEIDPTSEQFINAIKLKLPGSFTQARHRIEPDQKGRDRVIFEWFGDLKAKPGKGKGASKLAAAHKPASNPKDEVKKNPVTTAIDDDDDWLK